MEPLEIFFDKKRLGVMFILCSLIILLLLVGGVYINPTYVVRCLMFLVLVILTFGIFFVVKKWIKGNPALIINDKGIWDNSTALSVGWVEWRQIKEIKANYGYNMITVIVKNPKFFIERESNWLKKVLMTINWKLDESPIHLNDKLIKISCVDLLIALQLHQNKTISFYDFSDHLVDDHG